MDATVMQYLHESWGAVLSKSSQPAQTTKANNCKEGEFGKGRNWMKVTCAGCWTESRYHLDVSCAASNERL